MNPNQIDFVRRSYDIYKNVIRPFAPTGKIYHHTPELFGEKPQGVAVLERSASNKSAGVIGVFKMAGVSDQMTTVYPKGVDIGASYEVTFDNSGETVILSGYEMKMSGIKAYIGASLSSELIVYEKK